MDRLLNTEDARNNFHICTSNYGNAFQCSSLRITGLNIPRVTGSNLSDGSSIHSGTCLQNHFDMFIRDGLEILSKLSTPAASARAGSAFKSSVRKGALAIFKNHWQAFGLRSARDTFRVTLETLNLKWQDALLVNYDPMDTQQVILRCGQDHKKVPDEEPVKYDSVPGPPLYLPNIQPYRVLWTVLRGKNFYYVRYQDLVSQYVKFFEGEDLDFFFAAFEADGFSNNHLVQAGKKMRILSHSGTVELQPTIEDLSASALQARCDDQSDAESDLDEEWEKYFEEKHKPKQKKDFGKATSSKERRNKLTPKEQHLAGYREPWQLALRVQERLSSQDTLTSDPAVAETGRLRSVTTPTSWSRSSDFILGTLLPQWKS